VPSTSKAAAAVEAAAVEAFTATRFSTRQRMAAGSRSAIEAATVKAAAVEPRGIEPPAKWAEEGVRPEEGVAVHVRIPEPARGISRSIGIHTSDLRVCFS
jgi:hypothetical protein